MVNTKVMSKGKNLLAGLAGAVTLNVLHESLKKLDTEMPRVDLVGEEAVQKTLEPFNAQIEGEGNLYRTTLVSDLLSNGIYYSMIGAGSGKNIWRRAFALGIAGGVGAVVLPKPLGLDPRPVNKTNKTRILTVGYYLTGALVTGAILSLLNDKDSR
jgi:hypothetical protein